MNDLEITKACAEAMGMCVVEARTEPYHGSRVRAFPVITDHQSMPSAILYEPLHDDAQAMALVKKFQPNIYSPDEGDREPKWDVYIHVDGNSINGCGQDLNRAICECVAKMQEKK